MVSNTLSNDAYDTNQCVKNLKWFKLQYTIYILLLFYDCPYFLFSGLLNLRGSDITYNPVFYSYVIVTHTDVHLFVDDKKLDSTVPEHFKSENLSVIIQPYDKLHTFFNDIVRMILLFFLFK